MDKQGNLSQYINANGDRTAYYYQDSNDPHNLTKKVLYPALNPKQPQLLGQWQYDKNDRAIYESLADGKQAIRMQYDANAPLNKAASLNEDGSKLYTNILTNALGQQTHYQYKILKGNYRTVKVEGAGCQSCGTTTLPTQLDEHGNLIEKVIGDNTYHYTYDGQSRLTRIDITTEEGNRQWLQSRQYQGDSIVPTVITKPSVIAGKQTTTTIRYNQYQQPVQVTQQGYIPATTTHAEQSIQRQISYAYGTVNGSSKLISIDGVLPGAADTITYQYNAQGQLIQINYPEGLTQRFNYDETGRITRFQDIDTLTTDYLYDTQGQVIQTTKAGKISKVAYDAQGRLQQLVDPLGQTLNYQYNAAGELSQVSDGKLAQINLIRDIDGNLTQADLLVNGKVEQQKKFDVMNASDKQSLITLLEQLNTQSSQNIARPDLANHPFALIQDQLNFTPLPKQSTINQPDIEQKLTTYHQDDFGNTIQVDSPTTGMTTYQYNTANQLIASQNALGHQHYLRDNAGRIVDLIVTSMGQKAQHHQIFWGSTNRPIKLTYPEGEETFSYTADNQLLSHSQTIDGKKFTISYQYDHNGRLVSRTLPDGQVISYQYNGEDSKKSGLLNAINLKGVYDRTIISGLNSDTDTSLIEHFKFGNGVDNTLQKDLNGRIVLAGNPQVGQTVLNYNNPDNNEPSRVQQSAQMTIGNTVIDNGISAEARKIIDHVLFGQAPPPLVQPQQDIIQSLSQLPKKDQWGRTIQQGTQHYQYDSQNRLISISVDTQTGNQTIAQYRYNTLNQRIAKTTYSLQGVKLKTTYFFYDGNHLIAESTDEPGQKSQQLKQYVWMNDTPIAVLQAKQLFFIHTDHRNAPIAVTDITSRVVWQATNEDFGFANINAKSQFELNLRLSNQYYDSESGLHYNTNRYFDALNARYLSADPLGLAVGPDLFAFAMNQPHSVMDGDGRAPAKLAVPSDAEVLKWNNQQKLEWVFKKTAEDVDKDVASALLELVSNPTALASTTAIFVIWAGTQFTPYGWAADLAIAGVGYLFAGLAILDIIKGLAKIAEIFKPNCKPSDLIQAVNVLKAAIKSATQNLATSIGVTAGAKVGKLFRTIFKRSKVSAQQSAAIAKITYSRHQAFMPSLPRDAGFVNMEAALYRNQIAPWKLGTKVTDVWLNPGKKIYMVVDKFNGEIPTKIGGWASDIRFQSITEARKALALTEQFKPTATCCDIIELTVKSPVPARSGWAGPQTYQGKSYTGGGQQYEFLLWFNQTSTRYQDFFNVKKLRITN